MTTAQLQDLLAIMQASGASSVSLETEGYTISANFNPTPGETTVTNGETRPKFVRPSFTRGNQ